MPCCLRLLAIRVAPSISAHVSLPVLGGRLAMRVTPPGPVVEEVCAAEITHLWPEGKSLIPGAATMLADFLWNSGCYGARYGRRRQHGAAFRRDRRRPKHQTQIRRRLDLRRGQDRRRAASDSPARPDPPAPAGNSRWKQPLPRYPGYGAALRCFRCYLQGICSHPRSPRSTSRRFANQLTISKYDVIMAILLSRGSTGPVRRMLIHRCQVGGSRSALCLLRSQYRPLSVSTVRR